MMFCKKFIIGITIVFSAFYAQEGLPGDSSYNDFESMVDSSLVLPGMGGLDFFRDDFVVSNNDSGATSLSDLNVGGAPSVFYRVGLTYVNYTFNSPAKGSLILFDSSVAQVCASFLSSKVEESMSCDEKYYFKCLNCDGMEISSGGRAIDVLRVFTEHTLSKHFSEHLPYQCSVCNKQFSTIRLANEHVRKTHKDMENSSHKRESSAINGKSKKKRTTRQCLAEGDRTSSNTDFQQTELCLFGDDFFFPNDDSEAINLSHLNAGEAPRVFYGVGPTCVNYTFNPPKKDSLILFDSSVAQVCASFLSSRVEESMSFDGKYHFKCLNCDGKKISSGDMAIDVLRVFTEHTLSKHFSEHLPYQCSVCNKQFSTIRLANEHVRKTHKDMENSSHKRESSTDGHDAIFSTDDLSVKFISPTGKKYTYSFSPPRNDSLIIYHPSRVLQAASLLNTLFNKDITISDGKCHFACAACNGKVISKEVNALTAFVLHMLTKHHQSYRPYQCSLCSAFFANLSKATRHLKSLHKLETTQQRISELSDGKAGPLNHIPPTSENSENLGSNHSKQLSSEQDCQSNISFASIDSQQLSSYENLFSNQDFEDAAQALLGE